MTRRMVMAMANPHTDILGHCTGRLLAGRGRAESEFDAEIVFEACKQFGVAVEINSRPERLTRRCGCSNWRWSAAVFWIDTDAHAPGQLDWQPKGCERAAACGVPVSRIVNSWPVDRILDRTAR